MFQTVRDYAKCKNLQLSICAEFEEVRIRNREVQGGRQIRICQYATQPGLIRNCSNTPPKATSGSPPKDASSPKSTSQLTLFQHVKKMSCKTFGLFSLKLFPSSLQAWYSRMKRSLWWFGMGFAFKSRDALDNPLVKHGVTENGRGFRSQESGADERLVRLRTYFVHPEADQRTVDLPN